MDTVERVELADLAALEAAFPEGVRGKRIHAVGAGGHGISAGLLVAHTRGALVTGCDHIPTPLSAMLCREGVPITVGHDTTHVADCDLVVTNPAVTFLHPNHPELAAARALGIPVSQWQSLLGLLMRGLVGVSVAGVHGKGSTTALLGAILIAAGLEPTVEVGDVVRAWDSNVRPGQGRIIVNEADEFNYNFLSYHPRMVVLTEVEYDHPEFFDSYEEIRDAFAQFLGGMDTHAKDGQTAPTIVTSADSPGCRDTLAQLPAGWPGVVRTFSVEGRQADAMAHNVQVGEETSFDLTLSGARVGRVALRLPGRHNVANAVAAAAAARALGVSPDIIVSVLGEFEGLKRRFEIIEDSDVTWVDDYAHHPHAVALTIATARLRFPGRRIVAIFQPTLYTRLQRFLTPFAEALAAGDEALVVEIQPSRERDTGIIHGRDLVQAIQEQPAFARKPDSARYGGDLAETAALLHQLRRPGDVLLVMGSGPVNQVIELAREAARR
jgi:UDP-N-acetylmuramate--alanine ligase